MVDSNALSVNSFKGMFLEITTDINQYLIILMNRWSVISNYFADNVLQDTSVCPDSVQTQTMTIPISTHSSGPSSRLSDLWLRTHGSSYIRWFFEWLVRGIWAFLLSSYFWDHFIYLISFSQSLPCLTTNSKRKLKRKKRRQPLKRLLMQRPADRPRKIMQRGIA